MAKNHLNKEQFLHLLKIVEESINVFNRRHNSSTYDLKVKYLIKGGASIMAQAIRAGKSIDLITFDIDVAPIFLPFEGTTFQDTEYEIRAKELNVVLYEEIKRRFRGESKLDDRGGLQTMQIQHEGNWLDIIDFSYIDPNDDASTLVKAIGVYYGSYKEFVYSFFKTVEIYAPPALEICVVKFGLERLKRNLELIVERRERVKKFNERIKRLKLMLTPGIPEEDRNGIQASIAQLERFSASAARLSTPEFKERIKDKGQRYLLKYKILHGLLEGRVDAKCIMTR